MPIFGVTQGFIESNFDASVSQSQRQISCQEQFIVWMIAAAVTVK
jgi:hypothetical protein